MSDVFCFIFSQVKPDFVMTDGEQKVKLSKRNESYTPGTVTTVEGWGRINQVNQMI
jgi:hypothetical protein